MEKIKNLLRWVGTDGFLHFLVCYAMMLAFTPIVGAWWTLLATVLVALAKEGTDFFVQKDNDKDQVIHDLICDAVGILMALMTMLIWTL